MALQRERQVAFLKKKQLLEDESKLKGGAGLGATPPAKNTTTTPTRRSQLKDRLGRVLSPKEMKAPLSPVSSCGAPSSIGVPQGEL